MEAGSVGANPGHRRAIDTSGAPGSALEETAARYKLVLESIDAGFCILQIVVDKEGKAVDYRFLETNPAFVEQTGLVGAIGRSARELVPNLEEHWFETYGRVAATGEPIRFQSGSPSMGRWFNVFAFRVGRPEERKVALLFNDISETQRSELERDRLMSALELERARLQEVFRKAPSFIVAFRGMEMVYEFVNEAYYQLVGHREIVGKPLHDALPEMRDQPFKGILQQVLLSGEPWVGRETPVQLQRTPGSTPETRYLDMVFQALVEADGTRSGVVAHGSDVTEQVLARAEVERLLLESEAARAEADTARAEAETANRAKSDFLANMSHELRTPINAITGYTDLLELGIAGPLTPQQTAHLGRIKASTDHLLGLINEILDLARVESGQLVVEPEHVRVTEAVHEAIDVLGPQASEKVRISNEVASDSKLAFWGDPDRVRQILVNLLSNAAKFAAGETVTISSRLARTAAADAHLAGDGPWIEIRVDDTGLGIPPEKQKVVFDPFVQVDSSHTRQRGGTGLGLTISRQLARLMEGDLTLESGVGRGSCFSLWIPAALDRAVDGSDDVSWVPPEREVPRLAEVGHALARCADRIVEEVGHQMKTDPLIPVAASLNRAQLEDHTTTFLVDIGLAMVALDEGGAEPTLIQDGTEIQRMISHLHGAQRARLGWDEVALRREFSLLREATDKSLRKALPDGAGETVEESLAILGRLLDQSERVSLRGWNRAYRSQPREIQ